MSNKCYATETFFLNCHKTKYIKRWEGKVISHYVEIWEIYQVKTIVNLIYISHCDFIWKYAWIIMKLILNRN